MAVAGAVAAVAVMTAGAASAKRSADSLTGAGSSLVAPAVSGVWGPAYSSAKGVNVQYSSIGSGKGIAAITNRSVDFGASDAPMTDDQAAACKGCAQVPWALAGTGPVENIPGVNGLQLHLTGAVLAKIYLGQITNWSDPAVKKLNPKVNLPSMKITVVHRSDGSGDSFVFTDYLSKVSPKWKSQVGSATTVSWPTGVGGNGNSGVAALVKSNPGSIGYVSTFYVVQNHLHMVRMKNRSGRYVYPSINSIESAAQILKKVPGDTGISITNPPKSKKFRNAGVMATFTYAIVPKSSSKAAELRAFFTWALQAKQQASIRKDIFAPVPKLVVKAASKRVKTIQ
ncbi:MAG TPA: phosphate ABC transporter substrate-binding protein PstS [Gaiellaceae bacterium]|nr:phosphate ABC transporter substrate-binding protein PstS [Gaiellaceae bacterium]